MLAVILHMTSFESILTYWHQTPNVFTPDAWQTFIDGLSPMQFSPATIEIDNELWGGFWQGDVIAPGYVLPALELAFLRATRLDETFTETTPEAFLQILQTTLTYFPNGAWLAQFGPLRGLCVAYLEPGQTQCIIIWLVNGKIIAGYRDTFIDMPGCQLWPIRPFSAPKCKASISYSAQQNWLLKLSEWQEIWSDLDQATRVDRLVILHRAYTSTDNVEARKRARNWLKSLDWAEK